MEWYTLAWKRTFDVRGRSRRKEYWTFQLLNILIMLVLLVASMATFGSSDHAVDGMQIIFALYGILLLVPSFTCTVRRFHDIGRSGWWILIGLIPFGGIVTFIFTLLDSQPGPNEYGPNPKEAVWLQPVIS